MTPGKQILLDVGGTFIKRADAQMFPIDSGGDIEAVAGALRMAVGPAEDLSGIGIAIPGPFDYEKGVFLMKHKFASVYGMSFRELANVPDNVPLVFCHDVIAVLLGAVRMLGLNRGNTALVTLGTGLGFAHAVDGQVQYSPSGSPARSLWNLPAEQGGILEDYVSGRGICRAYELLSGSTGETARSIAMKAYDGDATARKAYESAGEHLGCALEKVSGELGITTVLFGGQIAQSLSLMEEPLLRHLKGIRMAQAPHGAVYEGLTSLF